MNVIVPIYLMLGILWAVIMFKYNNNIAKLRHTFGDNRVTLLMPIVALLWPIEMMAVVVRILRLCWYRFTRRDVEDTPGELCHRMQDAGGYASGFSLVCYSCSRDHRWLGSNEAMKAVGWQMVTDSNDSSHVYWFCDQCEPCQPPPAVAVCSICGFSRPWTGSFAIMESIGWHPRCSAGGPGWLCPNCAKERNHP